MGEEGLSKPSNMDRFLVVSSLVFGVGFAIAGLVVMVLTNDWRLWLQLQTCAGIEMILSNIWRKRL